MKSNPLTWVLLGAAVVLVYWLAWLWYGKQPAVPETYQVAAPAKPVADLAKVDHPAPPKIKVLPKKQASKKLDLPADVAGDDNQQVLDTADIPALSNGGTAVTIINTETGDSKTLIKANPKPLFAFLRTGAAGLRYGIASGGDQQGALFVRQDVVRIGNVHLSATAEGRTVPTKGTSEAYLAAEVSCRW